MIVGFFLAFFFLISNLEATQEPTVVTGSGTSVFIVTPGTGIWTTNQSGIFIVTPGTGTWPVTQSGLFTVTPGSAPFTVLYSTSVRLANVSTATITSVAASSTSATPLFAVNVD